MTRNKVAYGSMLSEDQLNAVTDAVHARLRGYRRAALVGYVILFAGISASQIQGHIAGADSRARLAETGTMLAQRGCVRSNHISESFQGVLDIAQRLTPPAKSAAERATAKKFYDDSRKLLVGADCTKIRIRP